MRSIGSAEKALDLMVKRGATRTAFGKPLIQLGKNLELVSRARIEIEAMRLMVLKAAKAMDVLGNREARVWVSMVKAMVPEKVCTDHRPGDADPRRHRHLAVVAAVGDVRQPARTCASPTARTRSITWWSAAPRSAGTDAFVGRVTP